MKKHKNRVYVDKSTIPTIGNGLFANKNIKKGSVIANFKGKLRKPGKHINNHRSNISFDDKYILDCAENDLASYANDIINFTKTRRKLMETLRRNEPFYKKHPNSKINSEIRIDNDLHKAWLVATDNILIDEEIFCHYSFCYWFCIEISQIGFLQEDEIEQNGFPEKIFEYPAFNQYIKEFYPKMIDLEIIQDENSYNVVVHIKNKGNIILQMPNYAKKISKIYMV